MGERFVQIHERLLRHIIQEKFNLWISNVTEDTFVLTRTVGPVTCGERQIPDTVLNPRFWTRASAGNSFDRKDGIMDQTNEDCRSRNFISTFFLLHQHLLVGR